MSSFIVTALYDIEASLQIQEYITLLINWTTINKESLIIHTVIILYVLGPVRKFFYR